MTAPIHGLRLGGGGGGGRQSVTRALTALALVVGLSLLVYAAVPAGAQTFTDYDTDDDGLIDIDTIAELQGIRFDHNGDGIIAPAFRAADLAPYNAAFPNRDTGTTTRMGCPGGVCTGFELMNDLDFAVATSSLRDWTPPRYNYAGVLEGNGYTISNLRVNETRSAGLIPTLSGNGEIRNLGLVNPAVHGRTVVGTLVGANSGTITASYAEGGYARFNYGQASVGGLVGYNYGAIIASFATAAASSTAGAVTGAEMGGLVGHTHIAGKIIASYAAGSVSSVGSGGGFRLGGLVGGVQGASSTISDSYCDTEASGLAACVGYLYPGAVATSTGYTTAELRSPTGYTGIYAGWNVDLDGDESADYPWNFRTTTEYPKPNTPAERATARAAAMGPGPGGGTGTTTDTGGQSVGGTGTSTDTLPPPLPRSIPPEPERAYDPAADHPEIYDNVEYGMAVACETHRRDAASGTPRSATVTFDLGSYDGPILLHLSLWRDGRFMAYETQGIALPGLERDGPRAWVRVETDPGETRFRLDGRRNGLAANLVLGYADCHRDDP